MVNIKDSESKYKALLENLPQKIFFKDKNSVYEFCNDNFARDLKVKDGEIFGKTDYDFFTKELAEKYRSDDKRIMEAGNTEDIEEEYIQDGQKVFVHTVKTPVKDENGNIVGILGIFWDITERKQAEEQLKKNEIRWSSLTENTNDIIMIVDSKSTIQLINKTISPYTIEETVGKSLYEYVPKEQHDTMRNSLANVFKTGKPETYEVCSVIPKFGTLWFSTKVVPIKTEGNIVSAILISTDITERKKAEEELKQKNEELERMNKIMMGRELKMIELKKEIEKPKKKLGGA